MKKKYDTTYNGWLIVDKEEGMSSAQVVRVVKQLFHAKKVGHGGTLDPLACGVLPIAINEATKTMRFCFDGTKTYKFTIQFGHETITGDREGEAINQTDVYPTDSEQIKNILPQFIGEIEQTPPMYSAIKIDGKRAYDLARAGEVVEMPKRQVSILDLELCESDSVAHNATFIVKCGKGTYVRTLAQDIALALGSRGYVTFLQRTQVGRFSMENALSLENLKQICYNGYGSKELVSITQSLQGLTSLHLNTKGQELIRFGQSLHLIDKADCFIYNISYKTVIRKIELGITDETIILYDSTDKAIGISVLIDGVIKPSRLFNL